MSSRYYPQIWQTVLQIPPGKVASYGQIADLAGLPGRARLVGKALSDPMAPTLPWHRVVRSDLHIAFAKGSSEEQEQRTLLVMEGVAIQGQRIEKNARWQPQLADMLFQLTY